MKAFQLHYTSCRRGQSGSAGFQTRTLTPGIAPDEQREIERRGIYRPPRDANQEPDAEEIQRDFPTALRFYTLESGRRALSHCCYTGRDYSGRWGNFFAHTLVLDNGAEPPLWPIDYYEWPGWQLRLASEDDTEQAPPPLPTVDLGEIAPAESFSFEEIGEFLREDPDRVDLLARMGRAVLLGRDSSRAVVIRDGTTDGLYWIAGIQKLFPPLHALELSYSTYQDDPRGCAAVNATTGATDFTFSDMERRYQFYMFDLTTGIHSEVPDDPVDYPAIAASWLTEEPAMLKDFFAFMDHFEHRRVEPELLSALHLFELTLPDPPSLDGRRLAAMIGFADRYATPQGRLKLLDLVAGAVEHVGALERPEDYECVIRFLSDGAADTGQPRHRELAFETWTSLLREHVAARAQGIEIAASTWGTLQQKLSDHADELAARFVAEPLWEELRPRLPGLSADALVFLLRITWPCLERSGRRPAWEQAEVGAIVAALMMTGGDVDRRTQAALEAVPVHGDAFAALSRMAFDCWHRQSPEEEREQIGLGVGRALGRVLASAPADVAATARRQLDEEATWEILFGEWLEILDRSRDPVADFERYRRSVLDALPGYGRQYRPHVALSILPYLPEKRRIALALDWLRSREIDHFPDDLAGQCLDLANRAVPLDLRAQGGEETARLVVEAATRRRIPLRPDRPFLRRVLSAVQEPKAPLRSVPLAELQPALDGIDAGDYGGFLAGFLREALVRVDNTQEHREVLLASFCGDHIGAFQQHYRKFFKSARGKRWPEYLQGALKFWLAFDRRDEEILHLAVIEKTARDGLALCLSSLDAKRFQSVGHKTWNRLDRQGKDRWRELETAVENRKRGPLTKLRGLFFGK